MDGRTQLAGSEITLQPVTTTPRFYYQERWLHVLKSVYGFDTIVLTPRGSVSATGTTLRLSTLKSPISGTRLVSLPFSDYCPITDATPEETQDVVGQAIELAARHRARYLELRTGPNTVLGKDSRFVASDLYVRWVSRLQPDHERVWSGIKKSVCVQIRKATKVGVTVRRGIDRSDMQAYYQLHLETRSKKHGMPAQPWKYFDALWSEFGESGEVQLYLASYSGTVVAGIVCLAGGDTMQYAYGGSDPRYLHLAPNNLLMWEAMKSACEQGYGLFDFGRTAVANAGLMQFKRGWGSEGIPLTYYYYPAVAGLAGVPAGVGRPIAV